MNKIIIFIVSIFIITNELVFSQSIKNEFSNNGYNLIANFYSKLSNIHSDYSKDNNDRIDIKNSILGIITDTESSFVDNISPHINFLSNQFTASEYITQYISAYDYNVRNIVKKIFQDSIIYDINHNKIYVYQIYHIQLEKYYPNMKSEIIRIDTLNHEIIFDYSADSIYFTSPRLKSTRRYNTINSVPNNYVNDYDQDGIIDKNDRCPWIKGILNCQGCLDLDEDGICDYEDNCPNIKGTFAHKGCPFFDMDNDGIEDNKDNCPDVPGNKKNSGCPDISHNLSVEIPLNFEQLFEFINGTGFLSILNYKPIKDNNSNKVIFTGSEKFLVGVNKKVNRWNKTITYRIFFNQINLHAEYYIPIKLVLDVKYDSRKEEFDKNSIYFKMDEQPKYYSYLINN